MDGMNDRRIFLKGAAAAAGLSALSGLVGARAVTDGSDILVPEPGIAKLNANENPTGPSARAKKAIAEAAQYSAYYVGENVRRLKSMIAERHGLSTSNVALSSGSSGVLTYLAVAASRRGEILCADLFWDTTAKAAERQGAVLRRLPKSPDLSIDLGQMAAGITSAIALVHVTNPNNPTGLMQEPEALRKFCRTAAAKTYVLVDEAYNEVTDDPARNSMVDLVREGHNVAVARTFSKIYGLAGLRIGYMLGSEEIIEQVNQFSLGDYALNQAGVAAALASYNDEAFIRYSKAVILEGRGIIEEAVRSYGLRSLPSQTNFLFVDLGGLNAETFRAEMAQRGVLIRGIYRDYTNWSRVSMGRLSDVQSYVDVLPQVLEAMNA